MATKPDGFMHVDYLWDDQVADQLDPVERLRYRSNLLGADQRIATLAAVAVILAYLAVRAILAARWRGSHSLYLNIQVDNEGTGGNTFTQINQLLLKEFRRLDLRRMDQADGKLQITYYLSVQDPNVLVRVMDALKSSYPGSAMSLVEQNNLLGG
mgnify:CR=1 FL=1